MCTLPFKFTIIIFLLGLALFSSGCATINNNVLNITPEQYYHNSRKKYLALGENAVDKTKLKDIIRLVETGEKNARKSKVIDGLRLLMVLSRCHFIRMDLKEKRLRAGGKKLRGRSIYIFDDRAVDEEMKDCERWMTKLEKEFKTEAFAADFLFVKGFFLNTRSMMRRGEGSDDSFEEALAIWTELASTHKEYSGELGLMGRKFNSIEARFMLTELFIENRYYAEGLQILKQWDTRALDLLSTYRFNLYTGILQAYMGLNDEAVTTLKVFKGVLPVDCVFLDEALWWLKGVYTRQGELKKREEESATEIRIIEGLIDEKEVKGFFVKKDLLTPDKLLPTPTPHEPDLYRMVFDFFESVTVPEVKGDFKGWILPPYARDYGDYYSAMIKMKFGLSLAGSLPTLLDLVTKGTRYLQRENALHRYLEIVRGLKLGTLKSAYLEFDSPLSRYFYPEIKHRKKMGSEKRTEQTGNSPIKNPEKDKSGNEFERVILFHSAHPGKAKVVSINQGSTAKKSEKGEKESGVSVTLDIAPLGSLDSPVIKSLEGKLPPFGPFVEFSSSALDALVPGDYVARLTWLDEKGEFLENFYPLSVLKMGSRDTLKKYLNQFAGLGSK